MPPHLSPTVLEQLSKENLTQLYFKEHLTLREIANRIGCDSATVRKHMSLLGLSRRASWEALLGRSLSAHSNWKGGFRKHSSGYIGQKAPQHLRADKQGYVFVHILVWEQAHGYPVPEGSYVHHINGIRDDNRPENLLALPRKNHHYALFLQGLQKRIRELEAQVQKLRAERRLL